MNKSHHDEHQYYESNFLLRGIDHLQVARYNKGLGFKIEERQALGFHGLLPPAVWTQEQQVELCWNIFKAKENDLDKYNYLMDLVNINNKLFYQLVYEHIDVLMPVIYKPTVKIACTKYHYLTRIPNGIYISLYDKGSIHKLLCNWPKPFSVRAIVVTNGERTLEPGDAGALGICLSVGKILLYTVMAGIKPEYCLPVMIDVGTNSQVLLDDKFYIGIRKKRVDDKIFEELMDEFMNAVGLCFGTQTLIQFEHFTTNHNLYFMKKYSHDYCIFNDDIQCTAAVVLAGIITASRIVYPRNKKGFISYNCFVLVGAGSASLGIAHILAKALEAEMLTEEEAIARLFIVDSKGLIVKNRTDLNDYKKLYAKNLKPMSLHDVIKLVRPTVLIGAAGAGELFTQEIMNDMAKNTKMPVVISIGWSGTKSEIEAENAYKYTDGNVLFASGSRHLSHRSSEVPILHKGIMYKPKQVLNEYIIPGIVLGATIAGIRFITTDMFMDAAKTLSKYVTKEEIEKRSLYPVLKKTKEISLDIATKVATIAYDTGMAMRLPRPKNVQEFISLERFEHSYFPSLHVFPWEEKESE